MGKIRILIVDDHPAMRHGLARLIETEADLEIIGEAGNRSEALAAAERQRPDLVILDLALNNSVAAGIDLITEVRSLAEGLPILVYSMHDESIYAERALHAGACGYLMKQAPVRQVIEAIRSILNRGIYVSAEMTHRLLMGHVGAHQEPQKSSSPQECLSEREFEVFRMVGYGWPPREIAEKLCLSVKTVESHRTNIRRKLDLDDAAELTKFAVAWVHRTD